MKYLLRISLLLLVALSVWSCQEEGTVIEGQITNATNLQVFLDQVRINKASNVLDKVDLDGSGKFRFEFPEGLPAGIYNLRIGAKRINLALSGEESKVVITGDLNTLQTYDVQVSGSGDTQSLVTAMQSIIRRQYTPDDVAAFVDTVSNAHLAAYLAYIAFRDSGQFVEIQKKASDRLMQAYPNSEEATSFSQFIAGVEQKAAMMQRGSGPIQVGMDAPDIRLPNPDGQEYALSELKGQVVLLDFWASWCGPCRRENPNVVEVYNRYKDQGFTVFSVSLDGLDSRGRARFSGGDLDRALEGQEQRWVNAIEQDGLIWPYHVSDLKKWESAAGRLYGVSSIPRTFLIDREGKVAAVNLRGAHAIEAALQDLL